MSFPRIMRRLKPIVGALLLATITVSCSKKQDDYVRSAQDYITKRDYASALVQLKNAVAQTPNDAQVRMLMAEVFLHLGDVRSAEQELRRALALGSPREKVLPTLARTLLILGNPQRVVDEFKDETLADVDARAQLSSTVGVAHLELGDTRSAAETFNKILAEQPSNLSARVGNARVALLDRKYGEAGKQLAGILRDSPSAASALMLQAELQLAQGDRDAAMESYRRVGVANDKDIESRYRLGLLYLDSKQLPEASRLIEQIRAIAPKDLRADYLAAVAAWRQGQAAQAAELVTRVLARAPQHAPSMFLAGIAAQATGKAEAARNYLEKVRRHPLLGAQASRALIKTYLGSGEAAKAQEVVDEALTKAPKDPELLALAGEVALARGDMKKAGQVLSQAKEAQGSKARLAQTLIASGDATAGLNLLESEAEEGKEDEQSLITLAVYHLQHKNYDEALKRIRQFEAKQPKDALAPALRGVVLSSQSKPELARRELERALQLDAAHPLALDALASIDVREHKAGAAQARYEAVLRQQPGNETVALGYVAWLRAQNAGADKVLAVMRKLLVSNPDAVNARVAMVDLLLGYGEPGGAVQAAQELVGRKPDNAFALQLLAKAQLAAGNSEQALTSLRRV
ncbi:MAG TPA: XrtA/PEP-CTERM system TPR-repeat protein PrsT, partial [Burkholderiales bacterium]|nr:XrtA/PEP-CTERM system TPR-repeat protein PrsT [Burkholderiales bacterium]